MSAFSAASGTCAFGLRIAARYAINFGQFRLCYPADPGFPEDSLRRYGDHEAAYLAAAILLETRQA